ncbi:MAG TPA: hypothetical protein VEN81_01705, partial [Planctomycetota bacterium]|nr:hypothetical protein [Planctomycetota bacterium]
MALATLLAFLPALAAQEGSGDVLRGVVLLKGELPERRSYPAPTEREKAAFPEGIFTDPVDVDRERHVRSALVYVKAGLEKKAFVPPREPRILEIENFQLKPRMIGIMAGQELLVTNRDGILHAIHAHPSAPGNKEFNAGLPARDMSFKATFDAPEVALPIRTECLHDWETAWVAVLAHPYYAV